MESPIASFTGHIVRDETSGWTVVPWPDSVAVLDTGKTVKVSATVDDLPIDVTLMPSGKGCHFLPLKAATRKMLKKDIGDSVAVRILARN